MGNPANFSSGWCRAGTLALVVVGLTSLLAMSPDGSPAAEAGKPLEYDKVAVQGQFAGKKNSDPAEDLSGIACHPGGPGGALDCLIVNDESKAVQRAKLMGATLVPGALVPLVSSSPPASALGTAPSVPCPGASGGFKEFDGEGVTFAPGPVDGQGTFYVVGSHGCSRTKAEFRSSSFLLARISVNKDGGLGQPELTWRLSDALRSHPDLAPWFGQPLDQEHQGLNIEGIAAVGSNLAFGLRAPSVNGHAVIARIPVAQLFAPGQGGKVAAEVFPVALGEGAGLRDILALSDSQLLVLSGPAQQQPKVPYAVWVVDLHAPGAPVSARQVALLDDRGKNDDLKAEGMTVVSRVGVELHLLVLYDSVENGGPRLYKIHL